MSEARFEESSERLTEYELLEVLEHARTGDPDAISQFYFEVSPEARQGVQRVSAIKRPADIEDVTADAMEKVLRAAVYGNMYSPSGPLRGWVQVVGYRTALDFQKSVLFQRVTSTETSGNVSHTIENIMAQGAEGQISTEDIVLARLAATERALYVGTLLQKAKLTSLMLQSLSFRYVENKDNFTIAAEMGITYPALKMHIYRAHKKLLKQAQKLGHQLVPEPFELRDSDTPLINEAS